MRSLRTTLGGLLVVLLVASCGTPATGSTPSTASPSTPTSVSPTVPGNGAAEACVDPDIRGTIGGVSIADADGIRGSILINAQAGDGGQYPRAWVTIIDQTLIMEQISE